MIELRKHLTFLSIDYPVALAGLLALGLAFVMLLATPAHAQRPPSEEPPPASCAGVDQDIIEMPVDVAVASFYGGNGLVSSDYLVADALAPAAPVRRAVASTFAADTPDLPRSTVEMLEHYASLYHDLGIVIIGGTAAVDDLQAQRIADLAADLGAPDVRVMRIAGETGLDTAAMVGCVVAAKARYTFENSTYSSLR
ncbi:TPA: hypothetical protein EYO12_04020 [Candidatus Saccharibacteria bacterium]|nr:hypothetical protein [Candidatus Saccharibacteria bacterium]HIO87798.1 hypothetical protein [Candidatus Saccharibacteria bacterium]